ERTSNFNRFAAGQQRLDLAGKLALLPSDQTVGLSGDLIGDALVEERLLAFEHHLLVAQRANRQPGQHEARHEDSQEEDERDFFHRSVRSSAFSPASSSTGRAGGAGAFLGAE